MMKCIVLWFGFFVLTNAAKAPFIRPCSIRDTGCLLQTGRTAVPYLAAGVPELGVPAADPLYLENVNGDVADLKLAFIHMQVTGISNCKMTKLEGAINSYHVELECPITATGQYTLGGTLFVVPAQGDGDFEIKTDNIRIIVDFITIEAEGHWKITSYQPSFEPVEKFYIKLGNLFNGDREKAEPVLRILDNGWRDLVTEIGKPIILEVIAKVVDIVSKFFDAVPANELRLE